MSGTTLILLEFDCTGGAFPWGSSHVLSPHGFGCWVWGWVWGLW